MAEYINKFDVVNKLIRLENNYQFYKEEWDADTLYRRICELEIGIGKEPAADVAPVVHGRWFDTGVENATGNIYFCSVCRKYNNPNKKDVEMKRTKEKPAYCPNCGALMDLEGGNTWRGKKLSSG